MVGTAPERAAFGALFLPGYRWYLGTYALAMMADNIEQVISYWVAFQRFHSAALGGFAVLSHWLPYLAFSVAVGALNDRFDSRRLIQLGMLILGQFGPSPGASADVRPIGTILCTVHSSEAAGSMLLLCVRHAPVTDASKSAREDLVQAGGGSLEPRVAADFDTQGAAASGDKVCPRDGLRRGAPLRTAREQAKPDPRLGSASQRRASRAGWSATVTVPGTPAPAEIAATASPGTLRKLGMRAHATPHFRSHNSGHQSDRIAAINPQRCDSG